MNKADNILLKKSPVSGHGVGPSYATKVGLGSLNFLRIWVWLTSSMREPHTRRRWGCMKVAVGGLAAAFLVSLALMSLLRRLSSKMLTSFLVAVRQPVLSLAQASSSFGCYATMRERSLASLHWRCQKVQTIRR